MLLKPFVSLIILLTALLLPGLSLALSTDSKQTFFVQSDSAVLNHKTGISTYRGNVILTQGTTVVTADVLVTYTDKHDKLLKAVATGQLASYSTLPDNSKLIFKAVGQTINYYPQKEYVEFIGEAKATQGDDSFAGPQLNYDNIQQIVTSPVSAKGRTSIIIQPSQKIKL